MGPTLSVWPKIRRRFWIRCRHCWRGYLALSPHPVKTVGQKVMSENENQPEAGQRQWFFEDIV